MKVRIADLILLLFVLTGAGFHLSCSQRDHLPVGGKNKDTLCYRMITGWPRLGNTVVLSQPSGLGIDSEQHIFVFNRTGRTWAEPFPDSVISLNTILMLDRNSGSLLKAWGAGIFIMPHGLTVDRNNQIWVTDVALHQIFKFDHEGKLLMTIGVAGVPGNDSLHFNRPTDVAVSKDGSFYVSDGYRNSRIVKFSSEGKYLFSWGKKGVGPGEFDIPHAIDLDSAGNIYVADRENNRIQVFNHSGKFLKQIKLNGFKNLYSVTIGRKSQTLYAVDYSSIMGMVNNGSDIYQFDTEGALRFSFGRTGNYDGPPCRYHDMVVDHDGNIYVCDISGSLLQKFSPFPNK